VDVVAGQDDGWFVGAVLSAGIGRGARGYPDSGVFEAGKVAVRADLEGGRRGGRGFSGGFVVVET
jgi:hypothetical protein